MTPQKPPAIVLVAFGSLDPEARKTYGNIRATYQQKFPGSTVRIAFTAGFIRRILAEKEGIYVHGPLAAMAELSDEGETNVVVQSLHVAPASEFHDAASLVSALRTVRGKFGFRNLEMGAPLLARGRDFDAVSEALAPEFDRVTVEGEVAMRPRNPEETAVVLMGHGTDHPADSAYARMALVLQRDHRNAFLGTIDGFPGLEEVMAEVRAAGVGRVRLDPFLLVAGGHATKDLAGDDPTSWKSAFEEAGFEVEVLLRGMGENPRVVEVFIEHTKRAIEGFRQTL
ncbi:MAG TPA: sirohydrochlorin cobaltochelatase [Methanothrix sp.]|nr:sirohydrochlorin cobaltochelatase [Methanothrix sp.]HRW83281.1 sirohydrochlorin cobaltochelatase [Methanothrix sp.]